MTSRIKTSNATATRKGAGTMTPKPAVVEAKRGKSPAMPVPATAKAPSRLSVILQHLQESTGASIAELCTATGWQAHSIRGAIAGALKRKGHVINSSVVDGVRRYQIAAAA